MKRSGYDLADEVVCMGLGDADIVDPAELGFEILRHVVDEDVAVDILGLPLKAALEQQVYSMLR